MNEQINNGGPAFPVFEYHPNGEIDYGASGMTLRDWFAGNATEEDIESHLGGRIHPQNGYLYDTRSREEAKYAYADAMLAAREVKS